MKTRYKLALTGLCSAIAISGVAILLAMKKYMPLEPVTTISINKATTKSLKVDLHDVNPGTEHSYVIKLDTVDPSAFFISVAFLKDADSGDLDKYLTLTLLANETKIEKPLYEVLSNKEKADLGNNVEEISITYAMDSSVGNEAQNLSTKFQIQLTAKTRK